MKQISDLIKIIGDTFEEDQEIENLLNDLGELSDCFGKSKGISKASSIGKGLGAGNKIQHIPEKLEGYKDFIQHNENVKWLKWQMTGSEYLDISNVCPYCITSGIDEKKDTILAVKEEYNSKTIDHLNKVINVIHRLSSYFTDDTYEKIMEISQSIDGLKPEHEAYLLDIRGQIDTLITKINKIKLLGFETLKDFDKVIGVIKSNKIELNYIGHLNSESTALRINAINDSLEEILKQAGLLQGKVNLQRIHIEKTISEYNAEINNFLRYAGYNYKVDIVEDTTNQTYKLKLKHNDIDDTSIDNVKIHLSFGERNAFALVLFMFEVIKTNPDLVILDDPISSFDKNKKFAIINMLFKGKKSLRDKTVLMLTHDFDPIVDMVYNLPHKFLPVPKASYLENVDGILTEKSILKSDIKTFLEIAEENIADSDEDINKVIYLRRLLEIKNDKSEAYQLLSNIFKKRENPILIIDGKEEKPMTFDQIDNATKRITHYIPNFNYQAFFELVTNNGTLLQAYDNTSSNYEKLQLYRIINEKNSDNDVIKKFVNETFHIENDYMYQLNPFKYQTIPQYIINECDEDILSFRKVYLEGERVLTR